MLINPEVTTVPLSERPDELERKYPEVISICAVTRAMTGRKKQGFSEERDVELAEFHGKI